jgi:hypothetical protein
MRRSIWIVVTLLVAGSVVAAQTSEAEKLKQETEKKALELVEQILTEGQSLKLPENRLRIKAMAAGMLWEKDQPRARTYLQEAENDLKQIIQSLGAEQDNRQRKIDQFIQFRTELLRNLSQLDPQLALDLLRATKLPDDYKRQYGGNYDPEIQLEAELVSRAASRDPAKALAMAEELLQKGFSNQILNLADNLRGNEQSRPAVIEIYKKVISKLATDDFLGNMEAVGMAERMLYQAHSEAQMRTRLAQMPAATQSNMRLPQPVFDDQMFRELIVAIAKAAAKNTTDNQRINNANRLRGTLQSMQATVEKLAPAQLAALKARPNAPGAANAPNQPGFNPNVFNEFRTLSNNPVTTNDQLIEFAKKASPQEQSPLFQQIAMRALNKGETEQAKQIMDTHVKDSRIKEEFERMRESIEMNNAMRKGNLEEAKQVIARIPSPQRKAEQMISLAQQIMQKDKPGAASLLDEAALLLGNQVENVQQVNALTNLSRAFAMVTPERSFELTEAMTAKFNTIIAAASVLDGFEMRGSFEQGEAKMSSGGSLYWLNQFTNNLTYLATIDFERAKQTAERFDRLETRLNALVSVASGVLRPRPQQRTGIGVPMPPPPMIIR